MRAKSTQETRKHAVVSHEKWTAARKAFLLKEKKFTRLRDELNRQRRQLPWEKVEKEYAFQGPNGYETLADLFDGRSQLIVYHFMFNPDWDEGCPHCSFWADHYDSTTVHLNHRDATFVAISRAPLSKINRFKKRMGWKFKWLSSYDADFNFDYHVSFTPQEVKSKQGFYNYSKTWNESPEREGLSVFYKDKKGAVFHTYSCYARGIDLLNGTYNFLDLAPKGRDESHLKFPQSWVRHHDKYKN